MGILPGGAIYAAGPAIGQGVPASPPGSVKEVGRFVVGAERRRHGSASNGGDGYDGRLFGKIEDDDRVDRVGARDGTETTIRSR